MKTATLPTRALSNIPQAHGITIFEDTAKRYNNCNANNNLTSLLSAKEMYSFMSTEINHATRI